MVNDHTIFEIEELDRDIYEYFSADIGRRYISTLPTLIQIERHLRLMLNKGINCQGSTNNSENTQDNV